ncbi:MAG TPA: FtsX-like permease family protein [Bacteroidia bacterium]|nr:FtsX-like permease family protein [Bacteroidia bacterium]
MNISGFISRRYLFSKNNKNAINIISGISVVGFAVGSFALVVVLSVFNGFEKLVISLYNSFDPDIKILPAEGKVFHPDTAKLPQLRQINGILHITEVLEEEAALKYDDKQTIATIKGVGPGFEKYTQLDSMMIDGNMVLTDNGKNYAVLGYGIARYLSLNVDNFFTQIAVFTPKREDVDVLDPENALNKRYIYPSGVFSVEDNINNKYMIVPIDFARDLLQYEKEISAYEIILAPGFKMEKVQEEIEQVLGEKFVVKNRYQLQEVLYHVFNTERWATYFILTFILLVAAFNVIGSLTMLVIDKKRDISVLKCMGASDGMLRGIFFKEGLLIAFIGAIVGIALGVLVCWLQQTYGLVKLGGGGSFVVSDYPVQMKLGDIVLVFFTTMLLGAVTSLYPSVKSAQQEMYFGK